MENFLLLVFVGVAVAIFTAIVFASWKCFQGWRDGQNIYRWLNNNTADNPRESHKSILEISVGTRLDEDRAQRACRRNKRILQSIKKPDFYSIYYQEMKSFYEEHGMEFSGPVG